MKSDPVHAPAALPLLSEVPLRPYGHRRDIADLLRLALIPAEDAEFRAKAVAYFVDYERVDDAVPRDLLEFDASDRLIDLADVPARTPGGVAWKIAEALAFFDTDERWDWWRYLLNSALADVIDFERVRAERQAKTDE